MGDLNIDTVDITKDTCNYLSDLRDTFSLTHVSKHKKVHLLMFCLQTDLAAFTRRAFLEQVLAIITN